jgi:hypothetical protein
MFERILRRHRAIAIASALTCAGASSWVTQSAADAHPGRYVVRPGTVYDTKTKLTWQKVPGPTSYTWADANTYCGQLDLDAMKWRLPSVKELETLVDSSRTSPAIDLAAFPNTPSQFFWTASLVTHFPSNGWTVDFNRGSENFFPLTSTQLVRCVR